MAESEIMSACAEEGKTTCEATNYISTDIRLSKEFYPEFEELRAQMMRYNLVKSILVTTASDCNAVTDIMRKKQKDLLEKTYNGAFDLGLHKDSVGEIRNEAIDVLRELEDTGNSLRFRSVRSMESLRTLAYSSASKLFDPCAMSNSKIETVNGNEDSHMTTITTNDSSSEGIQKDCQTIRTFKSRPLRKKRSVAFWKPKSSRTDTSDR